MRYTKQIQKARLLFLTAQDQIRPIYSFDLVFCASSVGIISQTKEPVSMTLQRFSIVPKGPNRRY
jgi:hypothetical protein